MLPFVQVKIGDPVPDTIKRDEVFFYNDEWAFGMSEDITLLFPVRAHS